MGREKDAKEDEKAKHKATKLKRLSDSERAGAGGDNMKKSPNPTKATENMDKRKSHKKVKTPKMENFESSSSISESVKQEPEDDAFTAKKKGVKRKRIKDDPEEGTSDSANSPTLKKKKKQRHLEEEGDGVAQTKTSKKRTQKTVKKEEEEQAVSKKSKKTKEEIEEARQLKIKKKEEEEQNRWRWWEEEKYEDGVKWKFLEHKGPYFPPEYQPLPDHVHFYYNGKKVKLSLAAEEVALFFAQMLDHEYTTKKVFRENFFKDWRKEMTHEERSLIQDLDKCNFGEIHAMHKAKTEARKNMSKEEKKALKEANQKIVDEYGYCLLDHHKERIGNFKIEPPGLFRGRGEHPKQGMLKKRIQPEDVIINCSKPVFKSLKLFLENKQPGDELFDRLNTGVLNKHLSSLMPGLTAKVFRTYNASITLQQQLKELTNSQSRLLAALDDSFSVRLVERKKAAVKRCEEQLLKLEVQATDREENKQIALGTSKLNYLDPRISVAWCKNMEVPIEKIYNKTQREKFAWAIDMTEADFEF
ncbi:DNA topoisomerase 1 [Neolamprologus brichardi]|uniref:DNA topoisomerase 1 n=1 Tax=Neolamprologus brichardi TaxID=32507 RepID=UPI00164399F2|nr:DNA topoisomerase 1 [Neolamprologus brichardi]